jgi:outer membrane receptor protein involved in Fe transport
MRDFIRIALLAQASALCSLPAAAGEAVSDSDAEAIAAAEAAADSIALRTTMLKDLNVTGRHSAHLSEISKIDLAVNPVRSSQEILRTVPGLFIAQHAGGGKAEQMFLRGFDLDHGTDINISVDGMPVNMVSHAHGQGYADLHFLSPEVIDRIDFDKGNYDMTKGDLANAGYVAFKTKDRMPTSVGVEIGTHQYQRYRGSISLLDNEDNSLYVASSFLQDEGFFESPQHFKRFNIFSKYTHWGTDSRFNIIVSHFNSSWNASGQIPERAVDNGTIGWFGSLDASEGGSTSRTNVQFLYNRTFDNGMTLDASTYLSHYNFNLYSNFTFFLNDPDNGDEINQRENRLIAGANFDLNNYFNVGDNRWKWAGGAGFRYDRVNDIALYHTVKRERIGTYALGDIGESSLFGYAGLEINLGEHWLINPSVRVDWFHFNYTDKTAEEFSDPGVAQAKVSPKLNVIYTPTNNVQLFAKFGRGFHSNDARVVVIENGRNVLPSTTGVDVGFSWKPFPSLVLHGAGWYLYSQEEMVYVGDEAIVEPSGRSRRFGVDAGLRWEFLRHFYLQADYTYSHARMIDEPKGQNYIPLAPVSTFLGALTYESRHWKASAKCRFLGNRPANEDYSLTARHYFITDINAEYRWKGLTVGCAIENLFNVKWKEAQFATETFIKGDTEPITDICFTPGTPFALRGYIAWQF